MSTILPAIYVTAYPEFNSGGHYSPSAQNLDSGHRFPRAGQIRLLCRWRLEFETIQI